ncbi:Uncharacterised protein [Klebsiella oxytoca]|nr:Uncharacterised protein [Klebsiella oxytoca]
MTASTTGMMVTRSRCAVVFVSSAVAVTPPTSAFGSTPLTPSRSPSTAFSASLESAAKSRVALISTLPSRTAGAVGAPGAAGSLETTGTPPSASG